MRRIIAVCPKEFPGVSAVLKHGEALELWKHVNLEKELPENDLVILGAWTNYYAEYLEKHNCIVYLTSTFGQMEFSESMVEVNYLQELTRLLESGKIKAVIAGSLDVADFFKLGFPEKSFYCPYPFSEEYLSKISSASAKEPNSLGIFLPHAPRKNTLNQILAATVSGMRVYTNLNYNLPEVIRTGWLLQVEYLALISRLTMTLHCTFTESFSYGAAESLLLGTLPIVSTQICDNLNLSSKITCYQCDSVKEILRKINEVKEMDEEAYTYNVKKHQAYFRFKNEMNLKTTKDVLDKIAKLVV